MDLPGKRLKKVLHASFYLSRLQKNTLVLSSMHTLLTRYSFVRVISMGVDVSYCRRICI